MNYSHDELAAMGFASLGRDVKIHRSAVLIGCEGMSIGDRTRIDCFSLLSAGDEGIRLGCNVHLAAGCYLFGGGGAICMEDFSGLSSRVSVYTSTDDYVDGYMTNPTVPDQFRKVRTGSVTLRQHVVVGAGSVILPGVELKLGAAVAALTCVSRSVESFEICAGGAAKARIVGRRERRLLQLEETCRGLLE